MKKLFTIIFLFYCSVISGQNFSYPVIDKQASSIDGIIPTGWKILDSVRGDLNHDQKDDMVIILQHIDSVTIPQQDDDTVVTQPRILLILFQNKLSNGYRVAEQSNSFILNHDNAAMEDPYQSMIIVKGILVIHFQLFYNMGSWYVTNTEYKFQYREKQIVLIGAENNTIHRATHDTENYSFNFLTKKLIVSKANADNSVKGQKNRYKIDLKELKTFRSFLKPYSFEVVKDIYL